MFIVPSRSSYQDGSPELYSFYLFAMTNLIDFGKYFKALGGLISSPEIERERFKGIPRVQPSGYETSIEKRDRTLKHLLRANHHNYAVLYNNLQFHNHLPHVRYPRPIEIWF